MSKAILFDFDGVLTNDLIFVGFRKKNPKLWNFLQKEIFVHNKKHTLFKEYMRGEFNYKYFLECLSAQTKVPYQELEEEFFSSIYSIKVDNLILDFISKLKKKFKVALISDNIDIFSQIVVKNNRLDELFPVIINSFDYGFLKTDQNGELLDIAIRAIRHNDYKHSLMIDDCKTVVKIFKKKGGRAFLFNQSQNLKRFFSRYRFFNC
ncbi:MAG: hypothetical protein GF347_05230 [Candidatus Moranbacteria bacterium]|nr:hypothetical protein [Candidatus Moranbacteria bacterium]